MIEQYAFGSMTIDGVTYQADLMILEGRVRPNWWRQESHRVVAEDVADILAAGPDCLVVGRGSPGLMRVSDELKRDLQKLGVELREEPTAQALETFNRLTAQGKNVAAAFHLTC